MEQVSKRLPVRRAEFIDRGEVRMLACRKYAKRHVVIGRLLDLPRRRHPDRVAVEPQRRHHPRRKRPLATVVSGLQDPLDLSEVDVLEQLEDEVRQMPLR